MSVGLFNKVQVVPSFGSTPSLEVDGSGTADFAMQPTSDIPTQFFGMWCGDFVRGARTSATTVFESDGRSTFIGGNADATHSSAFQVYLEVGPPIISCTLAAGVGQPHKLGFFAATEVVKQTITGALSSVVDANAKAVLNSIKNALVAYGLAIDGTT